MSLIYKGERPTVGICLERALTFKGFNKLKPYVHLQIKLFHITDSKSLKVGMGPQRSIF